VSAHLRLLSPAVSSRTFLQQPEGSQLGVRRLESTQTAMPKMLRRKRASMNRYAHREMSIAADRCREHYNLSRG
jgi:hypothetical protein